ncbi:MAG TPA: Tad domain-containing protein [Actinomycetota bacterium]
MSHHTQRRGPDGERGTVAILFAILIVLLFTMVSLAIDVSDARARVRDNQSRVDFALLAAAPYLPQDPPAACVSAWTYLLANTADLPSGIGAQSPCSQTPAFPDGDACRATTPAREYASSGTDPYQVVFTYPVPDDHDLMTANSRTISADYDGTNPCQRMAMSLRHKAGPIFGGVIGSDGLEAPASAVVRGYGSGLRDLGLALLLLDPVGCTPLVASGNGGVQVYPYNNYAGFIAVDSDASASQCNPAGAYTTDANGTNPRIWSCGLGSAVNTSCLNGGDIVIHAMERWQRRCDEGNLHACEQDDVNMLRVIPQPRPNPTRISRAPVDHRYNCQTGYPVYRSVVAIPDCPDTVSDPLLPDRDADGFTSDYIDELHRELGTGNARPTGFLEYGPGGTADVQGPCNRTPGADLTLPRGNWYINCSSFSVAANVVIEGGNVVFQGSVTLGSQGSLSINTNPAPGGNLPPYCRYQPDGSRPRGICPTDPTGEAITVVLRNGSLSRAAQAPLIMQRTFVYLANGRIDLTGGSAPFVWTPPYEGPFRWLSLWSENSQDHAMAGQANQALEGVFFAPQARIDYSGSGAQDQQTAQFISYRLIARGNGALLLAVDPERSIPFPLRGSLLIR